MAIEKKPGQNTGPDGGIFREVGPRGGQKDNYVTVSDNKTLPPTTKPNDKWKQTHRTPDNKKK